MNQTGRINLDRMQRGSRRGNALVLVAGVLVLLVIVATAFITSTQGVRKTATAQRRAVNTDSAAEVIADDIAREISESLFVREIDPSSQQTAFGQVGLLDQLLTGPQLGQQFSVRFLEDRRLPLDNGAYVGEMNRQQGRYEIDRNFSWNFAPYETRAWTNWPDYDQEWYGFDELDGQPADFFDDNPVGQPGTSDTRWLRELEPYRYGTSYLNAVGHGTNSYTNLDTFSHYGHLTNLARPGNDWRICRDIADVTGVWSQPTDRLSPEEITGNPYDAAMIAPDQNRYFGGLLRDHHVPVEQWLPFKPNPTTDPNASWYGGGSWSDESDFWGRWVRWFDYAGYAYAQQSAAAGASGVPSLVPPNFYDLSNLDGDYASQGGGGGELGERPTDEFTRDTPRWHVGRVLTDADGDGFTDSFWFHVPGSGAEGTMQVVGVSITDNAGRVNANVGTRFVRSDSNGQSRTRGWTPSDLALVGQNAEWKLGNSDGGGWALDDNGERLLPDTHETWNVGLFDAPVNSVGLFDVEKDTWVPADSSDDWDLANYAKGGLDAIDFGNLLSQKSEIYPIYLGKDFDDSGQSSLLNELNVLGNSYFPKPGNIEDQANRLYYWQQAATDPISPQMGFTPFTVSDEIELRMNEGNNQPWLFTRFERSMGQAQSTTAPGETLPIHFLRSLKMRQEHSELVDRLTARQLFFDNRRKITLYSGARNEQLPPWLWWEHRGDMSNNLADGGSFYGMPLSVPVDPIEPSLTLLTSSRVTGADNADDWWYQMLVDSNGVGNFGHALSYQVVDDFYQQMREKLDLREYDQQIPLLQDNFSDSYKRKTFSERLPYALYLALASGDHSVDPQFDLGQGDDGVLGVSRNIFDDPFNAEDGAYSDYMTRKLAAAYAANLLSFRDQDSDAPLYTQHYPDQITSTNPPPTYLRHRGTQDIGAQRPPIFLEEELAADAPGGADADPIERPGYSALRSPQADTYDPTATKLYGYEEQKQDLLERPDEDDWERRFLGMELQPFILEAFVAHVVEPWQVPERIPDSEEAPDCGDGSAFGWENDVHTFIEYTEGDVDLVEFTGNPTDCEVQTARNYFSGGRGPKPSKTVAVVQLANPYERPLPLFDRDPDNPGQLDRDRPLYKVRLFGQEVTIDDEFLTTMRERGQFGKSDYLNSEYGTWPNPVPNAELPLYLPPSTPEAPYTLILYTHIEDWDDMGGWIDFLDIHPADHFYRAASSTLPAFNKKEMILDDMLRPHQFRLARDLDGDGYDDVFEPVDGAANDGLLEILPGDLICGVGPEYWGQDRRSYDRMVYDGNQYVDDKTGEYTNGEDGVGVELVRIHRRDALSRPGVEVAENNDGSLLHEYEFDVVIDRTGGQLGGDLHATLNDGVDDDGDGVPDRWGHQVEIHNDEFYDAVSFLLPAERLPHLYDLYGGAVSGLESPSEYDDGSGSGGAGGIGGGALPGSPSAEFPTDPAIAKIRDRLLEAQRLEDGFSSTEQYRYIRELLSATAGLGEEAFQFNVELPGWTDLDGDDDVTPSADKSGFFSGDADGLRWCQWARYTRAWAVDPNYPYLGTEVNGGTTPTGGINTRNTALVPGPIVHADRNAPRYIIGQGDVTRSKGRPVFQRVALNGEICAEPYGPLRPSRVESMYSPYQGMEQVEGYAVRPDGSEFVDADTGEYAVGHVLGPIDGDWAIKSRVHQVNIDPRDQLHWCDIPFTSTGGRDGVRDFYSLRYMWSDVLDDVDPADPNDPARYDFAVQWGNVFDSTKTTNETDGLAFEPDGRHHAAADNLQDPEISQSRHWQGSGQAADAAISPPWITRNYRLPNTYLSPGLNGQLGDDDDVLNYVYGNRKPVFFDMNIDRDSYSRVNDSSTLWETSQVDAVPDQCMDRFQGYDPFLGQGGLPGTSNELDSVPLDQYMTYAYHYPDKGFYGYNGIEGLQELAPYGLQMLQKDANFEQVGEVLNVWNWGHELFMPVVPSKQAPFTGAETSLEQNQLAPVNAGVWDRRRLLTVCTFSEFMRNLAVKNDPEASPRYGHGALFDDEQQLGFAYWTERDSGLDLRYPDFDLRGANGGPSYVYDSGRNEARWLDSIVPLTSDRWRERGYSANLYPFDHARLNRLPVDPWDLSAAQRRADDFRGRRLSEIAVLAQDVSFDNPPGVEPSVSLDYPITPIVTVHRPFTAQWMIGATAGSNVWSADGNSVVDDEFVSHIGHAEPAQPAGQRVLDLFVCDGPGVWDVQDKSNGNLGFSDGAIDPENEVTRYFARDMRFANAGGFRGEMTPGLVNVNTATIEAMRTLPHMYKMVHGTPDFDDAGSVLESTPGATVLTDPHPRVGIPEAIMHYRARHGAVQTDVDGDGVFDAIDYDAQAPALTGYVLGPSYADRGTATDFTLGDGDGSSAAYARPRGDRGIASLGELFNLTTPAPFNFTMEDFDGNGGGFNETAGTELYSDAWTMGFAANDPFIRRYSPLARNRGVGGTLPWNAGVDSDRRARSPYGNNGIALPGDVNYDNGFALYRPTLSMGSPLSTDVIGEPFSRTLSSGQLAPTRSGHQPFDQLEAYRAGDRVAGDAEEANMLFSGMSNMISTRSDMFTVHFRVRTFKQNAETGVWDATDADAIVDDSRYVMLVDRSNVDKPSDRPRILYLQKVQN